jgi:rhodanese-related sulfurtransferase
LLQFVAAAALSVLMPSVHAAGAFLVDKARLGGLLKLPGCQLIDVRGEGRRAQQPIPLAQPYKAGMEIKAGTVIVVGDSEQQAVEAARVLAQRAGRDVFAFGGGYAAWREAQQEGGRAPETVMPQTFTIPSNTCEQGAPLQEYKK